MMDQRQKTELLEKFEDATEWPLLFLALAMIPLLLVPMLTDVSHSTQTAIDGTFYTIWAIFAVELAVRTYLAEHRISYLIQHWYDVAIVVVPFLRPLRVARSARALRVLRLSRVVPFFARAWAEAHGILRKRGLQFFILGGIIIVFFCALLIMLFEQGEQGAKIDDYGTAVWWAMSTVTTVGYGDTVPVTPEGRGIAIILMLVGIAFFSWLTANIAAFLVEAGGGDHVTNEELMAKLAEMEAEIKSLRGERRPSTDGGTIVVEAEEILDVSE